MCLRHERYSATAFQTVLLDSLLPRSAITLIKPIQIPQQSVIWGDQNSDLSSYLVCTIFYPGIQYHVHLLTNPRPSPSTPQHILTSHQQPLTTTTKTHRWDYTSPQAIIMASEIDIYNQYPLQLDSTSKAITLPPSSSYTPSQTTTITTELQELNALHRSLISLDPPNIPPPPLPINPKRSAQITKLRDSGNAAYRKNNHAEAVRLYSYAIEMALSRPGWEPVTLAREELAGLFGNRAQAQMGLQAWPEGFVDAQASVDSKPVGNVKAWWRVGKCLAEMSRYAEAKSFVLKGLEIEGRASEGGKELVALLEDVEAALARV